MPNWIGKWSGGRAYVTRDGRTVWVIQKDVHGVTRNITLDARNEDEAKAELALFNRDRGAYLTKQQERAAKEAAKIRAAEDAVHVDPTGVGDFLKYLAEPDDGSAPRTTKYLRDTRKYLGGWAHLLQGKDLRFLKLKDLQQALPKPVPVLVGDPEPMPRKKAIISIKTYCSWLESRGRLEHSENASRGLKVPASRRVPGKKGYSLEIIEATYTALSTPERTTKAFRPETAQAVRDVFQLAARHGLHYTEIQRIAEGHHPVHVLDTKAAIAGTVEFLHKSGDRHVLSLTPESLQAALRRQKTGVVPVESLIRKYLERAKKALGHSKRLHLSELRHSFDTLAQESGEAIYPERRSVPLEIVVQVTRHSVGTARRFYDNTTVPVLVRLPLRLFHPDDPVPARAAAAS